MRLRNLRRAAWAVSLGVLALGFDALVPVHFAYDLAEAVAPHRAESGAQNFERRLWAMLSGHLDGGQSDRDGGHHHETCAVCAAVGALGGLGGFAPAAGPAPPVPPATVPPIAVAASACDAAGVFPAAYRSRAPPSG